MNYAFWNNKGGVGKTFLCFAVSSEFALRHPETAVVVIDMCPQANVSEIFLGGNGSGTEQLERLLNKPAGPQTIGGYYHQRILNPHSKTGTETDFLIKVKECNKYAPDNIYLIAGDPSIELQVQTINNISVQDIPERAWRNVHSWIVDLQDAMKKHFSGRECVFFIDCNPSFSSYTEQAILAADRLIVPCTADGSSARGIRNVSQLVYGYGVPPQYSQASFSAKTKLFSMVVPKIHIVAMNRSTMYADRPARAFTAMFNAIEETVKLQREKQPDNFSRRSVDDMFCHIPDAQTAAIVASYRGQPISQLQVGGYDLDGTQTQINAGPLERYRNKIDEFVGLL